MGQILSTEPPEWAGQLHSTHRLYHLGGIVCCRMCALVTSGPMKCSLNNECRRTAPAGSATMLSKIDQGILSVSNWAKKGDWPDGDLRAVVKPLQKLFQFLALT